MAPGDVLHSDNNPSYALATGKRDQERLTILNELHNPSSLALLNIAPGMRVLTIGCGIGLLELEIAKQTSSEGFVLGTDISEEQLLIAEEHRKSRNVNHLQFLKMDVLDIDQIPGHFDRIHCRFVLTHLPLETVFQILPILYNKLAKGGFLLLEEITTVNSFHCIPPHLGYDKWKKIVEKQFVAQKSDMSPGEKTFQYLQSQGYSVSLSSHQPVLSTPREKSILSLGILSISQSLLQKQLASSEELEETVTLLHQLEQDSRFFPRYNPVSQISVNRL